MSFHIPWYRDENIHKAVRQFILALVLLGLALMGYEAEITNRPAPTPPIEAEAPSQCR